MVLLKYRQPIFKKCHFEGQSFFVKISLHIFRSPTQRAPLAVILENVDSAAVTSYHLQALHILKTPLTGK